MCECSLMKIWVKLYACVKFCGELVDDGGEESGFVGEHVAAHEVPVREAGGVCGEHNCLPLHSLLVELVAVSVLDLLLKYHCLHELVNIFVAFMVSDSEAFNVVREQTRIRMIKALYNAAVIVHAENVSVL